MTCYRSSSYPLFPAQQFSSRSRSSSFASSPLHIMLGARLCLRTVSGCGLLKDQKTAELSTSPSTNLATPSSSSRLAVCLCDKGTKRLRIAKSGPIFCDSSRGNSSARPSRGANRDHEYLEASILVSETAKHYQMRRQGFREDMAWQASRKSPPFSVRSSDSRVSVSSFGLGFLRQFQNPTIFLKISCDGDFLLPIIVGELAVEKLIDVSTGDGSEDCPDLYQFVSTVTASLGYEMKMVHITERVVNTYHAKLYLGKAGDSDIISVDVQPSDAINMAKLCKAPILVNKQIFLADAIRIGYGMGRSNSTKTIYDVTLDSAPDGPDPLSEELSMLRNMNLAAEEERFGDAAMWRKKLMKLRSAT